MRKMELDRCDFDSLTDKQRTTISLIETGMTSKEVARKLGISPHTIDQRIASARKKLGLPTRRALISLWRDRPKKIYDQTVYEFPYVENKLGIYNDTLVGCARSTAVSCSHLINVNSYTDVTGQAQKWIERSLQSGHTTLKRFKTTLAVFSSCAIIFALMYPPLIGFARFIASLF